MGLFDRFYYGKAGKADYTPDDLPTTRKQLFFEVLKTRFWSLMRVNLLQLIFWLPFLFITMLTLMQLNAAAIVALGGGDASQISSLLYTYCLLLIPCLLITGPSSAAAARVTRNWARDQHAFLWSDFWEAFRENWKQALAVSAITSVMPLLMYVGYMFYGNLARDNAAMYFLQIMVVLVGLVWAMMLTYLYPMMVGYKMSLGTLLRNALLLTFGRLPFVAGIRLLTLLPIVLAVAMVMLMGSAYGILFTALYYLLIGFALHRLVYAAFANGVFDRYINARIPGAPVNQGLRAADDDDEDDER